MDNYEGIVKQIILKASNGEPLSSLWFEEYNLKESETIEFVAYCLGHLPQLIAIELLLAIKERTIKFSEKDWKNIVNSFSGNKDFANRTLINFLLFHTDAPMRFIEKIGLNTAYVSNDFGGYFNYAKKYFYGELNGINQLLYEKLNLNLSDLDKIKKIGTSI